MKSRFEGHNGGTGQSDAIRSNIAQTRDKMDHTLDEISRRLTPRHLIDEFLEMFRSHQPDKEVVREKASAAARKAGDTASQVGHALADVIRNHPIPTLLIGAGVAWAFYEGKREESDYYETEYESEENMNYETSIEQESPGIGQQAQEKIGAGVESTKSQLKTAKEKVQEKLAGTGERIRGKSGELRERAMARSRRMRAKAGEIKDRMGEGTRRAKDRFVETSDRHPLSTGLGFLAIGLLAGLALPATRKEDEWIGRTSDKLKHRAREQGREYMERGRQVVSAAASAAKQEAEQQGLTPEGMKQKAKEVASHAQSAAEQSANEQGLTGQKEQAQGPTGQTPPAMPATGKQV